MALYTAGASGGPSLHVGSDNSGGGGGVGHAGGSGGGEGGAGDNDSVRDGSNVPGVDRGVDYDHRCGFGSNFSGRDARGVAAHVEMESKV